MLLYLVVYYDKPGTICIRWALLSKQAKNYVAQPCGTLQPTDALILQGANTAVLGVVRTQRSSEHCD